MTHDIAIVGAGICGMCTAISLAGDGHRVTLFERDGAPPPGDADAAFFDWQRRGAAQFRHPHAFLGLMCNLIQEHYPELLEQFYAAGARRVGFDEMLPPELRADYAPEPGDDRLWVLMCRRATIETVMRHYVESLAGVEIINDCQVTGMLCDPLGEPGSAPINLTGLTIRRNGADEKLTAQIVIDASGRTTRFPRWFAKLGCTIEEENEDAEIVYYTRHYRLRPGQTEPPRGKRPAAGDLGYLKFGVFPGDNGHFAIILCVPTGETELRAAVRQAEQFNRICASIPGLEPWVADSRSEPTTEPFGIGDIHAVWRHYTTAEAADHAPVATNFFAVGDAAIRTNPLYGRGCSIGVMHANILAEVLRTTPDPLNRARQFVARTQAELRPIYDASLSEDQRGIRHAQAVAEGRAIDRIDSVKKWFGRAFGDALRAATREQIHVLRGLMRTFHLLEKPGEFLKDNRIKRTVFRYMLRGRKRNAAARLQPGPSRTEMYEVLQFD